MTNEAVQACCSSACAWKKLVGVGPPIKYPWMVSEIGTKVKLLLFVVRDTFPGSSGNLTVVKSVGEGQLIRLLRRVPVE